MNKNSTVEFSSFTRWVYRHGASKFGLLGLFMFALMLVAVNFLGRFLTWTEVGIPVAIWLLIGVILTRGEWRLGAYNRRRYREAVDTLYRKAKVQGMYARDELELLGRILGGVPDDSDPIMFPSERMLRAVIQATNAVDAGTPTKAIRDLAMGIMRVAQEHR